MIWIPIETFRIQILLTNVLGDESRRLYKTICLLNWILIQQKIFLNRNHINENMLQIFLKLFVGEEQFKYNSFKVIPLKKGQKGYLGLETESSETRAEPFHVSSVRRRIVSLGFWNEIRWQ